MLSTFRQYSFTLTLFGFLYILLIFLSKDLIPFLLGQDWDDSDVIAVALIPLVFSEITLVPLTFAYEARRLIFKGLISQIIVCCFKNLPLIIILNLNNIGFIKALSIYSSFTCIGYLVYIFKLNMDLKKN